MHRLVVAVLAIAAGCALSACSVSEVGPQTSSCAPPPGMVLILGAHRHAPAPSLDQSVGCRVAAAIRDGKPVLLVVASGRPQLITPQLLSVSGGTLATQDSRLREDLQRIKAAVAAARPGSPGVDDLEALSVAADAARSAGAPRAELVLLDSGLDDRGALDFTQTGMVAASPADVVGKLKASGNQPDLRGFPVLLVSTGYTSPPQAPLAAKWRSNVTQIWKAVLTSAGAQVEIVPQPAQGASVETSQPVELVPVPADQPVTPASGVPIVFTGESAVRFQPDSTDFVDPADALQAITPIAKWLAAGPSRQATVVGTTADVDSMAAQVALSQQRADRVRDELVALGASPSQISTKGVGSIFPQFTPDRDSSGNLLPGPATLNRSVRITLSGS